MAMSEVYFPKAVRLAAQVAGPLPSHVFSRADMGVVACQPPRAICGLNLATSPTFWAAATTPSGSLRSPTRAWAGPIEA